VATDFTAKAAGIEDQLAKITTQLETATDRDRPRLLALAASLRRSLRWYQARTGTRSDVHALSVEVAEDIHTTTGS
jgi:uncharacterized membrane-anchored protein